MIHYLDDSELCLVILHCIANFSKGHPANQVVASEQLPTIIQMTSSMHHTTIIADILVSVLEESMPGLDKFIAKFV